MVIQIQPRNGLLIQMDLLMHFLKSRVSGMILTQMVMETILNTSMAKLGVLHSVVIVVRLLLATQPLIDGVVQMPMVMDGQTQQQIG